ncbi:alpha-D-xyloside xylohydrolase [Bryocella elongata]|uniref:Alpha-D-xyloside xylohydrolase n=1 Tax=Bryocella elongata TaxID=863522 RepID=A0A1H5UNC1_9BACT|nr:hypothetical protein [Bryocella elongata]SEF76514.1 alpha-D-xyloside xylohydrolase [Bryocella elongata]
MGRSQHLWFTTFLVGFFLCLGPANVASAQQVVLTRANATVVLEGFAPNIVRVTMGLDRNFALRSPGGVTALPNAAGWTHSRSDNGDDLYRSSSMALRVSPESHWTPSGTQADIARYFNGSTAGVGIAVDTPDGRQIFHLNGWEMSVPDRKDGDADVLRDRRDGYDPFFRVGATFAAPDDEHYYGLGQNQQGFLDLRGHSLECEHDYIAAAGPSVCVPFVVTNKGYAIVWDNPSKTRVDFAFDGQTRWTSQVGQRVSFFVIVGKTYDELYEDIVC